MDDQEQCSFLDWLLKTEEDNISYDELKMLAQDRSRWCRCEDGNLPYGQNTTAAAAVCCPSVAGLKGIQVERDINEY